jgi:hypothetical protein
MYGYYRDNTSVLPAQNQFNPMTAMPVQNQYNPMMNMPTQNSFNPMMTMPMQNQYNPMMTMPAQNTFNPMMAMPMQNQYNPMPAAPAQNQGNPTGNLPEQLENLYPKTYNILKPVVENACEKMKGKHGPMHTPNQAEVESMVTDILNKVEPEVEVAVNNGAKPNERLFIGGGRRILRDFIAALLIGSLITGRSSAYYPGYYGYAPMYFY